MQETPNLNLPFIMEAQAQKHVTHNDAIRALDAIIQLSVLDRDLLSPPPTPADGERYIVGVGATGNWATHDLEITAFQDGAWAFYQPQDGWLVWVVDESQLYVWSATTWEQVADSDLQNIPMLGVNATADSTNKFAINSAATLFNHEGAGHQVKVNKNSAADTASVLFQSNWSGRAEFGTTGDDDWHVKVSPDGSAWNEALIADKATGAVRFPTGLEHDLTRKVMNNLILTPGGQLENSIWRFDAARSGNPRISVISSISSDVITLTTSDADKIFRQSWMAGVSYVRVWNTSKTPEESAWVKASPGTTQLQVTDSADITSWANGETLQLGEPLVGQITTNVVAVDISPMMQTMLGAVFRQAGLLVKAVISANGVRADAGVTPTGANGSFTNIFGQPDGSIQGGQITIPTTELSPISNSNLLFLREVDNGVDTILICGVSVFGIWV